MTIEFVQKKRFGFRKHTLTNDKIIVESKSPKKNTKYEVKLNRLGFNIHYQADSTLPLKLY